MVGRPTRRASHRADGGHSLLRSVPRWVKLAMLVAMVFVLVAIAVVLFGPGEHGPGRHIGHASDARLPSAVSVSVR